MIFRLFCRTFIKCIEPNCYLRKTLLDCCPECWWHCGVNKTALPNIMEHLAASKQHYCEQARQVSILFKKTHITFSHLNYICLCIKGSLLSPSDEKGFPWRLQHICKSCKARVSTPGKCPCRVPVSVPCDDLEF